MPASVNLSKPQRTLCNKHYPKVGGFATTKQLSFSESAVDRDLSGLFASATATAMVEFHTLMALPLIRAFRKKINNEAECCISLRQDLGRGRRSRGGLGGYRQPATKAGRARFDVHCKIQTSTASCCLFSLLSSSVFPPSTPSDKPEGAAETSSAGGN